MKSKKLLAVAALSFVLLTQSAQAQRTLEPTVEFHLQCYPEQLVAYNKADKWVTENCDPISAIFLSSAKDAQGWVFARVLIDGKVYKAMPRGGMSVRKLKELRFGTRLTLELDGNIQDGVFGETMLLWGKDKLYDPEWLYYVQGFNTEFIYVTIEKEQ